MKRLHLVSLMLKKRGIFARSHIPFVELGFYRDCRDAEKCAKTIARQSFYDYEIVYTHVHLIPDADILAAAAAIEEERREGAALS